MRKFIVPLGGALLFALAATLWFFVRRPPSSSPSSSGQPQEFSALQGLAERAAKQVLPEAGAAQQKVELTVPKEKIESETSRVKSLASDFGGSAIASPLGDGGADLLVQLPAERTAAFLAAVTDPGKSRPPLPALANTDKVFVEVILQEGPAPAL
jgi:hypothetical protein